ncbi:MAG: prepilin-type N-terminal cleavage/methylation domain-containing protein [Elusimicrobia bacterium]|jgi:Tfp pilus assembly protein PilV|nr:prepilin-type N-terminal cleavage/methylation domain-containing protein [Elusimicrobiota bacterium]
MMPPPHRHTRSGLTLVEALIALVVISIVFLGVMKMFQTVVTSPHEVYNRTLLSVHAQNLLTTIRLARWDEQGPAGTVALSSDLGPDALETGPADFDDIDDWNGYSDSVGLYTRNVSVIFVNPQEVAGVIKLVPAVAGLKTDHKQVRVTVTRGETTKTLSSLFSNG